MKLNFPKTELLSQIVNEYSQTTPDKIAITDGKAHFTYLQLMEMSDKISQSLIKEGVVKGDRICVITKKCIEIVPIAIAIWKAGGIYCPIDNELPLKRLSSIILNINPIAIIGFQDDLNKCNSLDIPIKLNFDICYSNEVFENINNSIINKLDNAIIIHTSGTTGLPKGVVLSHGSVISYFNSHRFIFQTSNNSRCLNTSNFHYDVSIQDTFQPLFFGAFIYIYNHFFIPELTLPLIKKEKFTLVTAVSTILSLITGNLENLDQYFFPDLKYISTGAEVCSVKLINKWISSNPNLVIVNGYGPSEVNSVTVSYHIDKSKINEEQENYYPIGRAHKDVLAVLVNKNKEVINEEFVDGELYLGGKQLMTGYWANPEQTEKAFAYIDGIKYYKTGDLCYYDEGSNLVYKGRNDLEVKHNGRRINLEEINGIIQNNFNFSCVDCFQLKLDQHISYLNLMMKVDNYEGILDLKKKLITTLNGRLPSHSLPNVFSFYNQNLQTSSGKVDRKLLIDLNIKALKKNPTDILVFDTNEFIPFDKH
jgi:D-alanine--poly(phosphoribitol) ligase subunit 1